MNIGLFKFKYGEEMIAEFLDKGEYYYIQNTASLMPTENMTWNLVTWMPYTDITRGFKLPKDQVWFITPLCGDMLSYYENWKQALNKLQSESN
jgi:hypothetical protein